MESFQQAVSHHRIGVTKHFTELINNGENRFKQLLSFGIAG